nr:proteasome subunit beta type-4-like [Equus caballus]XP_008513237.1 PREDICTED: proteasome subunit beta type-4 [Equus przewalskii]
MKPLSNAMVIAGYADGESFLGYVDMLGVAYEAPSLATGYGAYLAQPLLREILEKQPVLSQTEAPSGTLHASAVLSGCPFL